MKKKIKSLKCNFKKYMFFLFLFVLVFFNIKVFSASDLLDKAFEPSIQQNGLVDLGKTKDQVGNEILRESTNISINLSGITTTQRAPLIVRIAKLLLRITIVLSVTMVLYNGVLYVVQSSKGEIPKDPQKNLINILIGILLALSSLGIINLINSITISSLKTSEDLGGLTIGCQTGGNIVAGDMLKERICLNSTFGHPQNTMQYRYRNQNRIGNRCWFANDNNPGDKDSGSSHGDRKNIIASEMRTKCVEDMGGIVVE